MSTLDYSKLLYIYIQLYNQEFSKSIKGHKLVKIQDRIIVDLDLPT